MSCILDIHWDVYSYLNNIKNTEVLLYIKMPILLNGILNKISV